jgi:hypothetical protein
MEESVGPVSRLLGGVIVVGLGLGAVALVANAPKLLRSTRPFLRQGLKRGLAAYDGLRGAAAEFAEDVEDLVAEVQTELKQAHRSGAAPRDAESKQA